MRLAIWFVPQRGLMVPCSCGHERESGYAEFTPSGEGIDDQERPLDDPPSLRSGRCPPTYGGRARRVFPGA